MSIVFEYLNTNILRYSEQFSTLFFFFWLKVLTEFKLDSVPQKINSGY